MSEATQEKTAGPGRWRQAGVLLVVGAGFGLFMLLSAPGMPDSASEFIALLAELVEDPRGFFEAITDAAP